MTRSHEQKVKKRAPTNKGPNATNEIKYQAEDKEHNLQIVAKMGFAYDVNVNQDLIEDDKNRRNNLLKVLFLNVLKVHKLFMDFMATEFHTRR